MKVIHIIFFNIQEHGIVCPPDRRPYITDNDRRRPTYRDVPCDTSNTISAKMLPIFVSAFIMPFVLLWL